MQFRSKIPFVFSLLFVVACAGDEEPVPAQAAEQFANVDSRLWIYFARFEAEGKARGQNIDINALGIGGKIEEIEETNVAGSCSLGRNTRQITIDEGFWNRSSDLFKEFIIFHELGHCYLLREHLENENANGTCVSIMRSGTGDCRDNYTTLTRKQYVDELFIEN